MVLNFHSHKHSNKALEREIDGHERAEEALRMHLAAMEASMDGMAILDREGTYLYVNDAHVKVYGYDRPEELVGKTWKVLYPEGEVDRFERDIMPSLREKRQWRGEATGKRRDGGTFQQELSLAVIEGSGIVCVVRDITQRKRAEKELERKTVELERSNAELEHFAQVASHDLREPLVSIGGFAELLQEKYRDKLDAKGREFLSRIINGASRMDLLISDLLAYARVTTHANPFQPVDCKTVLEAALSNLRAEIEESGTVVTCGDLPTVTGDETQLVQLFQNLVGNAIKYRSDKPSRIHVSAESISKMSGLPFKITGEPSAIPGSQPAAERGWLLSVSDAGIGIDPIHFEKIFQLFYRVHADEKKYPGTGIGLAICRKIAERHGGRIWVESEPGKGSTFYFTIF